MSFPKNFIWGAAAASYQIEGAADLDGKGPSVYDMFCKKEGTIWRNQNGNIACDHYHRYKEDVALMKKIGLKAYRLSISWPRVLPAGSGKVNPKGLDFYDRLIDELLKAKIAPFVTLFHWDYPYELYCRGGWLSPESPDWFAEYTAVIAGRLSDRVENWMTFNEPQCFIGLGHQNGTQAPGDKLGFAQILQTIYHVQLSHGKAVQVLRAKSKIPCKIGMAPVGITKIPYKNDRKTIEAARNEMFRVKAKNCWTNSLWMDPLILGKYPETVWTLFGHDMPPVSSADLKTMKQPMDFFGMNLYTADTITVGKSGKAETVTPKEGNPLNTFKWDVTPEGMYWGPRFFYERYKLPIIITENGLANIDWVSMDGKVHDPQRIDFTHRYLLNLQKACSDGVDVRGYFHWSIMDNFEWAEGFSQRFGMIYVDYPTQKRTLKDSAYWYKKVIAANGENL